MAESSPSRTASQKRLLRTRLRRPRNLRRFAKPFAARDVLNETGGFAETAESERQQTLLYDVVIALHRDGTASYRHHTIARLFGDRELAEWDHVSRVDRPRRSRQTIRTAAVHLPDGRRQKARRIVLSLEGGSRLLNLAFHPLRPGVVVEFDEQVDDFEPSPFGPGLWYRMLFRTPEPRRLVRFTVAVAEPFELQFRLHHLDEAQRRGSRETPAIGGRNSQEFHYGEWQHREYAVRQWELRDLAGFDPDEWTPPPAEFLPWVDVTTLSSWTAVQTHLRRELSPGDEIPADLQRMTRELTANLAQPRDKAAALYDYTTRTIRYGRAPAEEFHDAPRSAKDMLADLRGDCKDKASLLTAMLREAGIPSQVVLVQTATQGRFTPLPAPWFDHAVVRARIDGEDVWFDPAGGPSSFGEMPYHDLGVPALVLGEERADLSQTPAAAPDDHCTERSGRGSLDEHGRLQARYEVNVRGHSAGEIRRQCAGLSPEKQQRLIARNEAADLPSAEITEVDVSGLAELTQHVAFSYRLDVADWCRGVGELRLLRIPWRTPERVSAGGDSLRSIPFVAPDPATLAETLELQIPAGLIPYEMPLAAEAACRWGTFAVQISVSDGCLVAKRDIRFLGGLVQPDEFAEWKRFRDALVRATELDVVLLSDSAAAAITRREYPP